MVISLIQVKKKEKKEKTRPLQKDLNCPIAALGEVFLTRVAISDTLFSSFIPLPGKLGNHQTG